MTRPSVKAGTSPSIPRERKVANGMTDKDRKEDVAVEIHSEQHPKGQPGFW
jgi:hypothetical protein